MSDRMGNFTFESCLHLGGELLAVRHDRHHAARRAPRCVACALRQRVDADAAIGTPVAAVERDDRGPLRQQILQADQPAVLVRQHERRHRLAGLRRGSPALCSFRRSTSRSTMAARWPDAACASRRQTRRAARSSSRRGRGPARRLGLRSVNGEPGGHAFLADDGSRVMIDRRWNCRDFPAYFATWTIAALYDWRRRGLERSDAPFGGTGRHDATEAGGGAAVTYGGRSGRCGRRR